MRQNSDPTQPTGSGSSSSQPTPSSGSNTPPESTRSNVAAANAAAAAAAVGSNRVVFGSGIQSDGVFSNLTAKPERGGSEKEEQPPVCLSRIFLFYSRTTSTHCTTIVSPREHQH